MTSLRGSLPRNQGSLGGWDPSNQSPRNSGMYVSAGHPGIPSPQYSDFSGTGDYVDSVGSNRRSRDRASSLEAAQVVDILRRKIAYLSGGQDVRGGPVITFPGQNPTLPEPPPAEVAACLQYLASIPSAEHAGKGFTIVIDNRQGYWRDPSTLFDIIQQCLNGNVHSVFVVRADQIFDAQRLDLSFRRGKVQTSFKPQVVPLARLQRHIPLNQLTPDFGGTLPYRHDLWLKHRLSLEKYIRECKGAVQQMDSAMQQFYEKLNANSQKTAREVLQLHPVLQESLILNPERLVREGRDLYSRLQADAEAGYARPPQEVQLTFDEKECLEVVKEWMELLEGRLDDVQLHWQERERILGQSLKVEDLERAMKTVVDWILTPGEKLLSSQTDIGDSYRTAEEQRKQHEKLELRCTHSYATYAELRHRVEETLQEGQEGAEDLKAQRDYMDTVCRSFAARLERRRNLLILSVRFHRLAEELSNRLDDLLNLLLQDIDVKDIESAETALRTLQEKVDTISVAAEQTLNEGQNLLDLLSLPIKNAFGLDVTPDPQEHIKHVQQAMEELQKRKIRCDELADVRKLKLQQILQLFTCERDAEQAIKWILELCDTMIESEPPNIADVDVDALQQEHEKYEDTARGTYEHGKQLLQAALLLRRSLRYDIEPNNQQAQRLHEAWKKFSQSISEIAKRSKDTHLFNRKADQVLDEAENLLVAVSQCLNKEIRVEDLVFDYSGDKDKLQGDFEGTMALGEELVGRLQLPVVTHEEGTKRLKLEDAKIADKVAGRMKKLEKKMEEVQEHWRQTTQGIYVTPEGLLIGPDGNPLPYQRVNLQALEDGSKHRMPGVMAMTASSVNAAAPGSQYDPIVPKSGEYQFQSYPPNQSLSPDQSLAFNQSLSPNQSVPLNKSAPNVANQQYGNRYPENGTPIRQNGTLQQNGMPVHRREESLSDSYPRHSRDPSQLSDYDPRRGFHDGYISSDGYYGDRDGYSSDRYPSNANWSSQDRITPTRVTDVHSDPAHYLSSGPNYLTSPYTSQDSLRQQPPYAQTQGQAPRDADGLYSTYGLPDHSYGLPNSSYSQPDSTYSQPNSSYGQPNSSYGQPNSSYGQPDSSYGLPDYRRQDPYPGLSDNYKEVHKAWEKDRDEAEFEEVMRKLKESKEWVRVRIQHMEPDLMEVGSSLEEARALRREHDELLMKLNLKQKDVTDLLARADDLAASQSQQEVYQAMADSLAEAWKDLNNQLEYRKMLLDQSISFHESALQFSEKMEQAQDRFMKTGVAQDVDSARRLLQQHQDMKKSILEASMQTLQEGQSLLDRIREMGMHADVQNRHATTAACYGIEHVLELLQDRRRHLEELWLQRRIKLEQCLQLLLLDNEVNKVSDWFAQTGDAYLVQTGLGDSLMVALNLQTDHQRFELQAREIQETVLRLVRTADQLVHSATYDAEGVRERLKLVDQKCENFMFRLDTRRKNLALAISFYTLAETALTKLDEIEGELNRTDLPRNSAALAEKHAQLSNAIVEVTTPALREGRILLERVGRDHPSVQGINNKVTQLQERSEKVQELCKARYEAGEKSQAFNQFQEKFAQLNSWLGQIGRATLSRYRDLGTDLNFARDFLEIHERLEKDARDKAEEVKALSTAAEDLVKSGDQESTAAVDQAKAFCEQWDQLLEVTQTRLRLARSYVSFHKKAQQLAISMDALEQYLKIEKLDASEVPDTSISHKETKYKEMSRSYSDVSSTGKAFIKQTEEVKVDQELETKRAVTVVEAILLQFTDRQFLITEYYEHWKVHVTTGKEFKTQWRQFIQDARKTIDWIMKEEKDFFAPFIAGHLGKTAEEAQQVKKKLEGFSPTIKKAQSEIEAHLKTAEMLSLKGDTRGQKDQIVNELLKIHTRFQARLNEYQVLINMTLKFFKNLSQLDKLIESTEKEFKAQELPKDVEKAEVMLKEHESSRIKIKELIDFSAEEGEQIVVRVRQQDSEAIAKDEVQKVLEMTESRRSTWERAWEEQRARLEQNFQISQFYFDLRQIHQELDELHRQLDSRHGNYGSSLSSVKMTSEAFRQFEASTQIIETKVKTFSKSSESLIRDQHYDSRRIRYEVDHVQKKWDSFLGRVSEYRAHLDESTKFFNLMDDSEEWIKSASQFLLLIGRKATECKTSADALDLIKQLEDFRAQGAQKQDDRLNDMYRLICTLYGQVDGPPKMQHVVDKNRTILESFLKAVQEMAILRDNLVKKEQIMAEVATVVETHAPKAPRFVQPLQNTEIAEGQRFTFECRIECDQMPKIEWFKEEMPITSPDYKQTYKDGVVTLTIEETFSADTAKYTCKATTQAGSTETSAQLTVRETYKKIEAPEFTKQLKAAEAPEGTQFMFECCVTGLPTPDISWYKNDVNVDNSPDFIITKINGTCCLKIRKLTKDHEAKYTCKATNKGGECGTTATLSVIRVVKPFFTVPLVNVTVQEGKTIRLECSFKAEPQPQIQWLKGDQLVTPSGIFKIIVEANMTALEINEVYPEDAGTYTVVARNIGGETRTQCVLGIEGMFSEKEASDIEPSKPRFVQGLKNKEVMEGNRARLDCVIVAQPEPEVIWYFNGRPVKESKDFQLLFEGDRCSLIIREVYLEDSGEYKCVAKNPHGFAESSCRLIVEPLSELSDASAASAPTEVVPPKFTQLLKDMEGIEGRQVRFECRVIGHPTPEVKWFRENQAIISSTDFQITVHRELHSLVIPEVFKEDAGNFMVRANNVAGEAKCYASLKIRPATEPHVVKTRLVEESHTVTRQTLTDGITHAGPEFRTMFKDMRVRAGESCTMQVIILGNPRPRVRWLFNNEPIVSPDYQIKAFGDNHSLFIPEVFEEDAGRFSIIAENESGKATCSALLEVVDESDAPPKPPSPAYVTTAPLMAPTATAPAMRQAPVTAPPPPQPAAPRMAPAPVQPVPPKPAPPQPPKQEVIAPIQVAPVAAAPPAPAPAPAPAPMKMEVEMPIPPKFLEPLKNISAEEGTRVMFEGFVQGKPEPTIKWYKAGNEVTNSPDFQVGFKNGRVSLTIPEVFEEDGGMYECQAKNEGGQVKSMAELVVKASMVPPQFAERLHSREVKEGNSVRFTVRVTGRPPPDVTWYREGSQIVSSPDFEIVKEGDVHSLYIPEAFYEDSGKFTICAENPAGKIEDTAELFVEAPTAPVAESASPSPPVSRSPSVGATPERSTKPIIPPAPPIFSAPLKDQKAREGDRVVLECVFPPYPQPERVQWFRNEVEVHSSPDYQISISNGIATMVIVEVFPEDAGEFSCVITINGVSAKTTMYLHVDAAPPSQPESTPQFDIQLTNQPLTFGQTAYFECKVSGNPPPEILWTRKGHPLVDKQRYKSTYDQYSGITTLTIIGLKEEDEGEYTCAAINSIGEASTTALLLGPERYANWQREQQAGRGRTPQKEKQRALLSELGQRMESPKPGTPKGHRAESPFKVSHFETRLMQEIAYREGRVDPHQLVTSPPADKSAFDSDMPLAQALPPRIEEPLKNFKLLEGQDVSFVGRVSGHPTPNIQWFHNGRLLKPGNRYEMKLTKDGYCSLRIRVAFPEDAGYYTLCATNIVGRETSSAELFIEALSKIDDTSYVTPETLRRLTRSPGSRRGSRDTGGVAEKYYKPVFRKVPADMEVREGEMVRFDCVVSGRPMPEIFWYLDGVQVHDDQLHKIVVNESGVFSLIIHATSRTDAGQYTCIARNRGGEDQFQVHLNVLAREAAATPRFIERLYNQTLREGQNAVFTCEATGVPVPMMSWQKDNKMLSQDQRHRIDTEGGRSTLMITDLRDVDNAWYQCSAVNIAGSASNRARLIVQAEPRKKEPERKLVITKRTTPTPQRDAQQRPARVMPTPDTPTFFDSIRTDSVASSNIDDILPDRITPMDLRDMATPSGTSPLPRPPTRELIKKGVEPAPSEDDMYNRDRPRPPKFKIPLKPQRGLMEAQPARFETRLVPIGDPTMKVEWFKDGRVLDAGHRFKITNDFGYVALDILYTYPEDNGTYKCIATNSAGRDSVETTLFCRAKVSVIEDTQLPEGMMSMSHIANLEETIRRDRLKKEVPEAAPDQAPPVFDLMPEAVVVEEGGRAKFMCKVSGYPRPRITWWVNGSIVVAGHRFRLRYDGMIHTLDIPKARDYDAGTVRVVAKNPLGEAECSTMLTVREKEDWRSLLKQAPRSAAEVELTKGKSTELRSYELDYALKKPKTTVVELRNLERATQEKAHGIKDSEVTSAFQAINLQHAQMKQTSYSRQLRTDDPNVHVQSEVHIERARYMLGMPQEEKPREPIPTIPRTKFDRKDPPTFSAPMRNINAKEGQSAKLEVNFNGFPLPDVHWFKDGVEIVSSRDFQISTYGTRSTLLIPQVFPEDSGTYSVQLINQFGMCECKAIMEVQPDLNKPKDSPPEFTVQMRDIVIRIGEPATFDCQITGYPRPTVYWCKDGVRIEECSRWKFIAEEDHFTLLIYEVRKEDQGRYEIVVTNKMGRATCTATLVVEGDKMDTSPVTAVEPATAPQLAQTMYDQTVDEGFCAEFVCSITATPEPVIQWFCNDKLIKPSKYFQMKSDGTRHSLVIAGAFPEDEGVYKCVARNPAGEVTCIAHLKVNPAMPVEPPVDRSMEPAAFQQPISSLNVEDGKSVRLEATVVGNPPPQVIWFKNGVQLYPSENIKITHETDKAVLIIVRAKPADSAVYTCRVMNPAGIAECAADVFVEDKTHAATAHLLLTQQQQTIQQQRTMQVTKPPPQAPIIIKAPSPLREVYAGNTTKIVVQLAAFPEPQFNWYHQGRVIEQSQRRKIMYEHGVVTLLIFNVQPQDSGEYMLRAMNPQGEVTWKTTLNIQASKKTVELPATQKQAVTIQSTSKTMTTQERTTIIRDVAPSFTHPLPKETTVNERSTARLEVFVDAIPQPRISWHFNGIELKPSIKYTISQEGKKSTLLIKNITSSDTGVYTCRAYSELGEAVSSTTVFVIPKEPTLGPEPPKFILPLQSCEAYDGEEVVLTCTVTGRPKPDIDWFHNQKNINKSEDFVISYNKETGKTDCVIVECLPDDQGTFKCVARNEAGQATTEATLQVRPPPPKPKKEPVIQPEMQVVVQTQMAPVQDSKVVRRQELQIDGENRLDTETVRTTETKTVTKIVKKSSGEPPRFTKPIQPQVVKEGENILFTAIVAGVPQPEITWLKDKKDMEPSPRIKTTFNPNTMETSMTITNATQQDIGVFSCRASNTAGRATCTANAVVVPPDAEVTVTEKTVSVKKEKVTMVGDQETRVVETSPQFVQQLLPQVTAVEGTTVTLEVQINAEPQADVFWYFNGQQLQPTTRLEIKTETNRTTLTIRQTVIQDSGEYIVRCVNKLGEVTSRCVVTITSKTAGTVQAPVPPRPVDETPVQPSGAPAPVQMRPEISGPEVPPAPMNEPCAVIPMRPGQGEPPKFIVPLRDQTVNDAEKVTFKVIFTAKPTAKVVWFFNGKQIFPSADFQIKTDTLRGESQLFVKEVFPDDEGEFMCKATNKFGTAVTACHLFVIVPSSSDDEVEKMIEKAVTTKAITLTTQQMAPVVTQRSSFSETIGQAQMDRRKEFALTYGIPQLPQMRTTQQVKQVKTTSGATKQMQYLTQPLMQQRRFSETIAIDRERPRREEVQVEFSLPQIKRQLQKSAILIQQRAALKGMKMEVEITQPRKEYVHYEYVQKMHAEAISTQRQEMRLELGGATPRFLTQLFSLKVMDGEEVHFSCRVTGLPMPEITWYKNNKVVVDNPDFKTIYNKATGECELFISEVFPQDTGEYRCVAVNQYGKAVTSATLTVESYEYVADSEEASASQAESYTKSEDEAEFIERTQAFIANMQKLRAEFQDEEIKEEEVEMTEEFHEEVVQMADVKWAIPQKTPMQTEETTQEVMMEVKLEQPVQEDVVDASVTSRVSTKPLTHAQTVEEQVDLQRVQEGLQAPITQEVQQQQQMQFTMETTSFTKTMETRVQESTQQMETQIVTEGIKPPSPQEVAPLQEAQVITQISQVEAKPMTHVQTVEEQLEPQFVQEGIYAPAPQEIRPIQEQPVQIEISSVEAKPMTHVQEAEFKMEPQIVQEGIVAPMPQEIRPLQEQQIQVEISSVEAKPTTHVQVTEMRMDTQQVQEGIQAPISQEVQFTQEGVVTMEISSVETKRETLVQEAEFKMEPQIVQEGIVAPVPQEIVPRQELRTQVEISSVEAKPMTHVQVTEMKFEPQVVQEGIIAPVPQEIQPMQEQVFQMQVPGVEQKMTTLVQETEVRLEPQVVQEGIIAPVPQEIQPMQEQVFQMQIPGVEQKTTSHVQVTEMKLEPQVVQEGIIAPVPQELQPLQEQVFQMQIPGVEEKMTSHVQETEVRLEPQVVQEGIIAPVPQELQPMQEQVFQMRVTSIEQKTTSHVQTVEERFEEGRVEEGVQEPVTQEVQALQEAQTTVQVSAIERKPETHVQPKMETVEAFEVGRTISPTADQKLEGEEEMVEPFEVSAIEQKPMTHVQVLEEKVEEQLTQEGIQAAPEEMVYEQTEDISAVGVSTVQPKPLAQVAPIEEQVSTEEISETLRAMSPQESQTTDIQVALSQGISETTMSMAAPVLEQAQVEQTEEYTGQIPSPEETQERQVTVQLMRSSVLSPTQSHALTLQEVLSEGAVEEGAIQEIQSEMTEGLTIPSKIVEQAQQQVETQHIGMVEERYSPEEEEDMFFDTFEPAVEAKRMEEATGIASKRDQATWQTQQQEAFTEITSTEEAFIQYDEERTSPAEVSVSLDKARLEDRKPSFVTIREQVVSPHEAEELPAAQVTEETSQQDLVQVTLDVAGKESPKLSHVSTSEDVVPVDLTHRVEEYTEESTLPEEVHMTMEAVWGQERPETRAPMLAELVPPELVSEDITSSIKEVRMIPSEVQPSYEPAVVERYRFETRVQAQATKKQEEQTDHFLGEEEVAATESRMSPLGVTSSALTAEFQTQTQMVQLQVEAAAEQPGRESPEEAVTLVTGTTEMAAASMEQTTVRAAQEITEERHVITEMVTEEIEVIKKPEVALMAPAFEIPLADTTVTDGERAFFECKVTGVPVPEVAWFIDGQEIKASNDFKMFYEDGYCTLEINGCFAEDEGEYTVRAINDAGSCISTAYLTVLPPSRDSPVETPIEEELVAPGATSAPEAAPKETVVDEQYRKMEVDFTVQARKEVMIEVPLPSGPEAPKFLKALEHKEVFENMPITLECHVSGQPEPEVVWYQDGKKMLNTQHTQLLYQKGVCRLHIDRVTLEDEAEYMCEAKNELGITSTSAEVLVEKLASAVEQVILEEYYDIEIEVYVKWKLPSSESQQQILAC